MWRVSAQAVGVQQTAGVVQPWRHRHACGEACAAGVLQRLLHRTSDQFSTTPQPCANMCTVGSQFPAAVGHFFGVYGYLNIRSGCPETNSEWYHKDKRSYGAESKTFG